MIAWVCRNKEGIIRAASVVEYTDPKMLEEWKADGRIPELVDTVGQPLTINGPLAGDARVLRRLT
jgi:hypothetical protein